MPASQCWRGTGRKLRVETSLRCGDHFSKYYLELLPIGMMKDIEGDL